MLCLRLDIFLVDQLTDLAIIICSLPHLEKLILRSSDSKLKGPLPLSPLLQLPERLSILDLFYFDATFRYFLEWLRLIPEQLSIHTLHLTMDCLLPEDLDNINEFLKVLGTPLELFRCSTSGMFRSPAPTFELIKLPQKAMDVPTLT
jgi:hypothetical protein